MKILVTGGAGFIGSNIVDKLIADGDEVLVIDNLSSGKLSNLNKKAKLIKMDVCSSDLEKIFKEEKFDVVNHHSAQIDVRKSISDPLMDANNNIVASINLFENCKKYGVKKIIFASSGGTIYGECNTTPPDEESKPAPLSPYGVAKLSIEYYLNYYSYTYDINTYVLRYANVYGPRQDPHGEAGVIAIFFERMLKNEDVFIYGDGEQLRDYVYIDDVVNANIICTKNVIPGNKFKIFNIGTSKTTSVNELFNKISELAKYNKEAIYKPQRTGELLKSYLDISRTQKQLGWNLKIDLNTGLELTYKYFKDKGN